MRAEPRLMESKDLDRLFAVAAQLFADRGFDGVSVREISRAAQFSMAAIYYHFRTKERLFEEVCLQKYEDFAQNAIAMIKDYQRSHGRATAVALAFFDLMVGDEDLFRLLQRDLILGHSGQPHFRSRPQYQQLRQFIDELLDMRADDPVSQMKSCSLAAMINGYCDFAMADESTDPALRAATVARHRQHLEQFVNFSFTDASLIQGSIHRP